MPTKAHTMIHFYGNPTKKIYAVQTSSNLSEDDNSWDDKDANVSDPRGGPNKNQWFEQWFVDILVQWHNQDPVGQREIDRNNDVFDYQNNRNPFIDNPEWVNMIWSTTASLNDQDLAGISIYPNPSTGVFQISNLNEPASVTVYDVSGRMIFMDQMTVEGFGYMEIPAKS